tara:strand:- start:29 stop:1579 length:1551 start_codon:yes stop_codon:yes gene_type:complete
MGIDNVAIKTFNSTGSQSVCRANEADETKLIESEFLTKCTTEYINGSGMSFISGSIDLVKLGASNPYETFTLPSDVDAISEITLQMSLGASGADLSQTFILDLIKKIEIKLGNLVVQTILPGDIYARNLTESGFVVSVNTHQSVSSGIYGTAANVDFALSIPFTGRSTGVNKSFLQAGAVTNNLTMKVYYNSLGASGGWRLAGVLPASVSTGVCVFSHSMTSTEKNFIAKNIINRPVNTSQSIAYSLSVGIAATSGPVTIDLSSVNINVSHILLTLDNSIFNSAGTVVGPTGGTASVTAADVAGGTNIITKTAHGFITGTPVVYDANGGTAITGLTSLATYFIIRATDDTFKVAASAAGAAAGTALALTGAGNDAQKFIPDGNIGTTWTAISSGVVSGTQLGVAAGWLKSAELILGNDRTGSVPGSCLTTNKLELFKLTSVASKNIYILKLAGSAFSTAGVPFSRLNNKKLVITYAEGFTLASYTYSTKTGMSNINVTCCGTQIQSTVGGTIGFSA